MADVAEVVAVVRQHHAHARGGEHLGAVGSGGDVPVEAFVPAQEAERVAQLVRDDGEEVVLAGRRRVRVAELRRVERRRIDEPAMAVGVEVEDDACFRRFARGVELGDPGVAELAVSKVGDREDHM